MNNKAIVKSKNRYAKRSVKRLLKRLPFILELNGEEAQLKIKYVHLENHLTQGDVESRQELQIQPEEEGTYNLTILSTPKYTRNGDITELIGPNPTEGSIDFLIITKQSENYKKVSLVSFQKTDSIEYKILRKYN
jgi:hypothetical protein